METTEARIDWITATIVENADECDGFVSLAGMCREYESAQNRKKEFRANGFSGWQVGRCQFGFREHDSRYMLRAHGELAHIIISHLLDMPGLNVPRIDLAVTTLLVEPLDVAQTCYAELQPAEQRRYQLTLVVGDGGSTLYIGSRVSETFGRIYDKGARDNLYERNLLWRYEIEFKRHHAKQIFNSMRAWKNDSAMSPFCIEIARAVRMWYSARGIPTLFDATGVSSLISVYSTHIADDDRTLKWLSAQVRPAVWRLVEKQRLESVLAALGIDREVLEWYNSGTSTSN